MQLRPKKMIMLIPAEELERNSGILNATSAEKLECHPNLNVTPTKQLECNHVSWSPEALLTRHPFPYCVMFERGYTHTRHSTCTGIPLLTSSSLPFFPLYLLSHFFTSTLHPFPLPTSPHLPPPSPTPGPPQPPPPINSRHHPLY